MNHSLIVSRLSFAESTRLAQNELEEFQSKLAVGGWQERPRQRKSAND
jgi:hypothetical protein